MSYCTLLAPFFGLAGIFLELEYQINSVVCSLQALKVKTNWTLKLVFFVFGLNVGRFGRSLLQRQGFPH